MIPQPFRVRRKKHVASLIVARVRPRTSKGITDLLLLNFAWLGTPLVPLRSRIESTPETGIARLFSRLESRSLSESTRQITPPTKNGHAPPPTESRKSSQSVNPNGVLAGWVSPCWVKLSRRLHSWWCPSVNSFKFQPCDHTTPRTQKTLISRKVPKAECARPPIPSRQRLWLRLGRYLIVFDPLTFVQWLMKTLLAK